MNIHNAIKANVIKASWRDVKPCVSKHIMLAYANQLKKSNG